MLKTRRGFSAGTRALQHYPTHRREESAQPSVDHPIQVAHESEYRILRQLWSAICEKSVRHCAPILIGIVRHKWSANPVAAAPNLQR